MRTLTFVLCFTIALPGCCHRQAKSNPESEASVQSQNIIAFAPVDSDADLRELIERNRGNTILKMSLDLQACTPAALQKLKALRSIEYLSLRANSKTRMESGVFVCTDKKGRKWIAGHGSMSLKFPPMFDDKRINAVAEVKGLKKVLIWYGSLTPTQRKIIRSKHPSCEIGENANKY